MTGNIPPTGSIGPEFTNPIGNESPTLQHILPQNLSQAQRSDPLTFRKSTGLPQEADTAVAANQAAALGGLRYASA